MKSKYKTMLKVLMGIMFTAGPVDNDLMYAVVLRFAKKEKWVILEEISGRYYLTNKGYKKIKDYVGGNNE